MIFHTKLKTLQYLFTLSPSPNANFHPHTFIIMAGMLDDDFSSAPLELPEEANKLYRVFRTVNTMLHKRGYIVDEADRNITKDAFSEKYGPNFARDSLSVLGSHPTTASKILVFFPRDEKVGIAPINEIMGKMTDDGIEHGELALHNYTKHKTQNHYSFTPHHTTL